MQLLRICFTEWPWFCSVCGKQIVAGEYMAEVRGQYAHSTCLGINRKEEKNGKTE